MEKVTILGIESSCDETAAAVVRNGREVLSDIIYSQIEIHQPFGGVVPEVASRNHNDKINEVVRQALDGANIGVRDVDAVAVTYGPGLVGALLVGVSFGKALAFAAKKPLVPVHHIDGHICANYINSDFAPPFVCLVVSGGHTHLVFVEDFAKYEVLGRTRDDAAGEAFDKAARAMGLPYPGGVEIEKLAENGRAGFVELPRVMKNDEYNFSFSGLKSAVLNYINQCGMRGEDYNKADLAASFQKRVTDTLVAKSVNACLAKGCLRFALAGGVAANGALRREMENACIKNGIYFHVPSKRLCTDNAAMIASAGYFNYIEKKFGQLDLNAVANLEL